MKFYGARRFKIVFHACHDDTSNFKSRIISDLHLNFKIVRASAWAIFSEYFNSLGNVLCISHHYDLGSSGISPGHSPTWRWHLASLIQFPCLYCQPIYLGPLVWRLQGSTACKGCSTSLVTQWPSREVL